jgi:Flp pilus assembly protein TadD
VTKPQFSKLGRKYPNTRQFRDANTTGPFAVLETSREFHPNDRKVLYALVYYLNLAGDTEKALRHARHFAELEPENPTVAELLRRLGG